MPRRKGHGIPPTKRVKQQDAISKSAPLKNKLYNEIPVVTAKEESLQMTVSSVPIKSESPSIISDALHSKYLHKKFKKMASALLSEEHHNQINFTLNGSRLKNVSRNSLSPASSDNERASPHMSSPKPHTETPISSPPAGRYVCSYCKLACAKPSVLQKHIRAHTNERPYPCLPCGFAFKTKSNLYKHCRSRAHALKLEETGEKMPTFNGEEGESSEDDSLSNVSTAASVTSRTELDLENREEIPKSIYKPKYRFMEHPVESDLSEKSDERKENTNSPPRLHLMIPVPNTTQSVSTPSPFTSGSSPSPEFLHRHINKLISENQAIVETNDPFWSKKFLQKTNSNDYFPVSTLTTTSPMMEAFPKKTVKTPVILDSTEDLNCDKQAPKHSKLALALLRPHPPVSPKFSNLPSTEMCDAQPLNLTTNNKEHNSAQLNRKRSYSEGIPERSPKLLKERFNTVPLKLHNHSVQDFRRFASTLSENNASVLLNHLDIKKDLLGNPQNPEGSIIKDLLLKARAANSANNSSLIDSVANPKPQVSLTPPVSDDRAYSPSSQFMCHLCRDSVSYRTAENLEMHQMYHCKGNDTSSRSSLNSPSPRSVSPSYHKNHNKEIPMVIVPSHPSPGPLLGSTPLVDSYRTSPKPQESNLSTLKRRKFDNGTVESRTLPVVTLRSLEGLSKSPIRSNLQMFGGEVKIIDHGETKTLRIEPSNRGNSKSTPFSISSHAVKNVITKENDLQESDSNMIVTIAKQGLHTGGSIIHVPQKSSVGEITTRLVSSSENTMSFSSVQHLSGYQDSNKLMIPLMSNTVTTGITLGGMSPSVHLPFQFPSMLSDTPVINPLTNITAYNPLTLPPATGSHSPGIPSMYSPGIVTILHGGKEIPFVPGMPGPHSLFSTHTGTNLTSKPEPDKKYSKFLETKSNTQMESILKSPKQEKPNHVVINKPSSLNIPTLQLNSEKIESPVESPPRKRSLDDSQPLAPSTKPTTPKRPQMFSLPTEPKVEENGATEKKFLRPTSLPLKPGTFVPKRQQSTPVLSLVSPETPRPRKSYGQLYLNGHAYTYLGLKCSTRMFFCTLNKPQPIYVPLSPEHNKVSMYSNWKVCTEADPNPCGLDPGRAMALYDSRHRPSLYTLAQISNSEAVTHSSYWTNRQTQVNKEESTEGVPKRVKIFAGGFESNEDYIYVRGRGRGRYVCEECGIRCKKPSMLKKHIRTHTDVRPFTCIQCKFSFKTKGNLTKHMKSKAHYKKCVNLGIDPVPTIVDDSNVDEGALARQQALRETQGAEAAESEEEEEEDEEETEDDDEDDEDDGDCLEQEAARSLLSLSETLQTAAQKQQVCAGLVSVSARPNTYPYSFTHCTGPTTEPQTPTLTAISAQREHEKVSQNTIMAREVQLHSSKDESVSASDKGHYYFPPSQDLGDSPREPGEVKQFTPIDLSQKSPAPEKTTRVCEAAMLLATICSTMERLPITTTVPSVSEDSILLQAYLTERAVQDSRIKQQQYKPKIHTSEVSLEPEKPPVSRMNIMAAKENALGILAQTSFDAHKASAITSEQDAVVTSKQPEHTTPTKPQAEFLPPSSGPSSRYVSILEDGRSMCNICNKVFSKPSQLRLHVNIHYFERPFRCEACAVSFRTKGHLQKHQRSVSHLNKVNMNSTFGTATTTNPRPFKCDDCKIAFRIHGHLAKHLRSKMHIMKLECLGKLPFGTYAELERSGMNMNDIDTTDCENSLESLQLLAQKLYEKDPSKLGQWDPAEMMPHHNLSSGDTSSEGEEDEVPLPTDHPPAHNLLNHHYSSRSTGPPDRAKTEPPSDRRTDQLSVVDQCL